MASYSGGGEKQKSGQNQHFVVFAMPRSATHFTTVFVQRYLETIGQTGYFKFRTFRDFHPVQDQQEAFQEAMRSQNSVLRITCPEETDNIERLFNLDQFFSNQFTIVINPRKDFEDLLLARLIPYYHWSVNQFDGLPVERGYYSFCESSGTWSPYHKKDIEKLVDYYKRNPLPWDPEKIDQVMDKIFVFFQWFNSTKSKVKKFPHFEVSTDHLLIESVEDEIVYDQDYPLIRLLNGLYGQNVQTISLKNMKQQSKDGKYSCFNEPDRIRDYLAHYIESETGKQAQRLIYS